jgi:geranylgeranyl diphosphate synthase type I
MPQEQVAPQSAIGPRHERSDAVSPARAFAAHLDLTKAEVDRSLARRLAGAKRRSQHLGGQDLETVAEAVSSLVVRGGKRFRPALLAAAFEAVGGEGGIAVVLGACDALELLQAYLLIHDDWMDGDELRRGGPTVHAALRKHLGEPFRGDTFAILAGDMASAMSQEALFEVAVAPARVVAAAREFARLQVDVVFGQMLDVQGAAESAAQMERMHDLKTGSYTVRGPLLMGAALAGANLGQRDALSRFAAPLGVAFQLRDDLLGTFGDPAKTGKSDASDVRQGKRTALVLEAEKDPEAARFLKPVLGIADAAPDDIAALREWLVSSGVKARVEVKLDSLLSAATHALDDADLRSHGTRVLLGAVEAIGRREI